MPKVKQYKQKFRTEWLKDEAFEDWIKEVNGDSSKAHCCLCKVNLKAKYSDLVNHSITQKHVKNSVKNNVKNSVPPVTYTSCFLIPKCNGNTLLDANLALFLACHSTTDNCDHLSDMLKSTICDSQITSQLKMDGIKCSEIIKNVLSPHFQKDLRYDVGDGKYSLILDESTDIFIRKMLGIVIIYFSTKFNKVVSTYLNLIELESCDAQSIVDALKCELETKMLDIGKLTAIGTDNASVMVDVNNGVYQKLKKEVPSLILCRCVCSSLQMAVSHAAYEFLPPSLEYLVSETYKWFSVSSLRQISYKKVYETINDDHSPIKMPANCQTRWLSIECAVSKILAQWFDLKLHFQITKTKERCYTSEILSNLYNDEMNYVLLLFLQPILEEIQKTNKLFESKTTNKSKLMEDLGFLLHSIASKLILSSARFDFDPLKDDIEEYLDPKPYLGNRFERKILELREQSKICKGEVQDLRQGLKNFLLCLYQQLKQRLPDNLEILKTISLMSVGNVLHPNKEPITRMMESMGLAEDLISRIEIQFNKIHMISWTNNNDNDSFWSEVSQYKDASGANTFEELSLFALSTLILPHSNAEVERVFSSINNIKSKALNRLEYKMMTAIATVKFGLIRNEKCCSTYQIPKNVLQKIETLQAYRGTSTDITPSFGIDVEPEPDE